MIDARRGEVFYAFYRQVPGGVQRLTPHQVGTPDDLASELHGDGRGVLLVGDGALRYAEAFDDLTEVELAEQRSRVPVGGARSCSSPTPALCGRSS